MLLKEIFQKIYKANAEKIKKLRFFMKQNKKRIAAAEGRVQL